MRIAIKLNVKDKRSIKCFTSSEIPPTLSLLFKMKTAASFGPNNRSHGSGPEKFGLVYLIVYQLLMHYLIPNLYSFGNA